MNLDLSLLRCEVYNVLIGGMYTCSYDPGEFDMDAEIGILPENHRKVKFFIRCLDFGGMRGL